MNNNFILNEEEKSRILKMHKDASSRHYLNESAQAQSMINNIKSRMAKGEKPDPNTVAKIKECITKKQLNSLMFLTTGAGAYALGVIAMLTMSGVGAIAGGVLALSGTIVLFITSLSEKDGGLGSRPDEDVKALLSCMGL
jgi:hypothetical protein